MPANQAFKTELKKYAKLFREAAKDKVNEADTVLRLTRFCEDVLGYDLNEITREQAIKSTYVDIALKAGQEIRVLMEAKAAASSLREGHTQQAQNYAANQGIPWVLLTNGSRYILYRVELDGAIEANIVFDIDIVQGNFDEAADCLWMLRRRAIRKATDLGKYYQMQRALSPEMLLKALSSERVVTSLRRELQNIAGHRMSDEDTFEGLKGIIDEEALSQASGFRLRRKPKPMKQDAS